MGILNKYADKKSMFVKLQPNQETILTIFDYSETQDSFGNGTIAYKVQMEDGSFKTLQKGSSRLARKIEALPNEGKNCKIKIKMVGEGFNTDYEITLIE